MAHCLSGIWVCRESSQSCPSGLKHRAIINGEDATPGLAVGGNRCVLLGAGSGTGRWPITVEVLRGIGPAGDPELGDGRASPWPPPAFPAWQQLRNRPPCNRPPGLVAGRSKARANSRLTDGASRWTTESRPSESTCAATSAPLRERGVCCTAWANWATLPVVQSPAGSPTLTRSVQVRVALAKLSSVTPTG